ncbi:hypothetical protein BTHI11S_03294 [Bosea thiooxidans]
MPGWRTGPTIETGGRSTSDWVTRAVRPMTASKVAAIDSATAAPLRPSARIFPISGIGSVPSGWTTNSPVISCRG